MPAAISACVRSTRASKRLRAEEMPTQHRLKSKPLFFVLDWKYSNIAETVVPPEQQQLTAADDDFGSDNVDRDDLDDAKF